MAAVRLNPSMRSSLLALLAAKAFMSAEGTALGQAFISKKDAEALGKVTPPYVLVNPAEAAPADKPDTVCTILTADGKTAAEKLANAKPRAAQTPVPGPTGEVEIESGIPVPEPKRGASAKSPWPVDSLGVGQSFFIPATAEVAEPWKRYSGVASSATKRFNKPNSTDRRRFIIRQAEKNGQTGARIWRIADAEPGTTADAAAASAAAAATPGAAPAAGGFVPAATA